MSGLMAKLFPKEGKYSRESKAPPTDRQRYGYGLGAARERTVLRNAQSLAAWNVLPFLTKGIFIVHQALPVIHLVHLNPFLGLPSLLSENSPEFV